MTHHHPDPLGHLHEALAALDRQGLRRTPPEPSEALSFCSNDYLGLACRFAPAARTGAGASRLIAGERRVHRELERELASWLGTEAALVFSSGYAANVGAVSALATAGDLLVSDERNHASIIDGARLSRARVAVTPHNDLLAIEKVLSSRSEARAWVVVESYYSMDADGPDLRQLRSVCDAYGAALYVDEAHALGVMGPSGRGRAAAANVLPDVLVGTLGKSLGSQGAFVAGSDVLRDWLWNRARSFVFSTGLAPVAAEAARLALQHLLANPDLQQKVDRLSQRLRDGVAARRPDLDVRGFGHVIPIVVGSSASAIQLSERLKEQSIFIPAIRPPTVPEGTARLRLTVTAAHQDSDIDGVIEGFSRAGRPRPPFTKEGPP